MNHLQADNSAVHASVSRLLDAAKAATANLPMHKRIETVADLRRALDVSAQTFGNWKTRGISTEGALKAELLFGVSAASLLSMVSVAAEPSPAWMQSQHSSAGRAFAAKRVAHAVSFLPDDSLPVLTWEMLMQAKDLPELFKVQLNDSALAPDLQLGDELTIDRRLEPRPGDLALLKDASGNYFARTLQQTVPSRWRAVAHNSAYAPLDTEEHNLTIVGISVSETRKRRRSDG